MPETLRHNLSFPPFRIPSDVDLLYRGETVVPLEPQAVRVLRYLVEHHDRVVTKKELLERVWPATFTTDDVLKKAIFLARRALNDQATDARFIRTYHSRGYRFVAPVISVTRETSAGFASPDGTEEDASQFAPLSAQLNTRQRSPQDDAARDPDYDQLIGRDAELQALCAEYRRTLTGTGRPVLIMGEPGIGKTQLARHLGRWSREQNALWLYGRFFDYGGSRLAPYEPFLDFLRAAFNVSLTGEASDLRAIARQRCGVTLPQELFVDAAIRQAHAGASPGDQFRAIVPLGRCFVHLCRERPLVMVLDDFQWADEASREMAGYLMRTTQGEPFMLVALARTEEMSDPEHPLTEWLKRQAHYRSYSTLNLKPLDQSACQQIIEAVFGLHPGRAEIPARDLRTLNRVTGGNPYFLTEILRLLVIEGAISYSSTPEGMQWRWRGMRDLSLPETVVIMARGRLDQLSEDVRDAAEHASVIGDEFRSSTLLVMTERVEDEIEKLLREAVRRGVLSQNGLSAGEDYRFDHTILRRVLYDTMPPRRRKELHARAARALATVYAQETDRITEAVSAHLEAAGDPLGTFRWSMRAWHAASARWHWSEAVASIERACRAAHELDHLGVNDLTQADRLSLLLGVGQGYYSVGRLKEAESALTSAIWLAESLDDQHARAASLLHLGLTRIGLSSYSEAQASLEEALKIYREIKDSDGVALTLIQLSSVQTALGQYNEAGRLIEQALEDLSPGSHIEAIALGTLGWARTLQGLYAEGTRLLESALDRHTTAGDLRRRALFLRRLHWAALSTGRFEEAIELAMRARDDFRSAGDVSGEAKSNMGIGQARIAQGIYEEGISYLNRTLASLKVIGDTHCEAETLWLLGRAHGEAGRASQAAPLLERALQTVQEIGDRDDEFRVLIDLARLKISVEDFTGGLQAADRAAEISEELQNDAGLGAALIERARAYLALKRLREAQEAVEIGVRLLDEAASGERWRGYWAFAQVLAAVSEKNGSKQDSLRAMRRAMQLLEEMREQLKSDDELRHRQITLAYSAPARDFHLMLLHSQQTQEAETIVRAWRLDK